MGPSHSGRLKTNGRRNGMVVRQVFTRGIMICTLLLLLTCFSGYASESSGEGHGSGKAAGQPKGWVDTDWYRVLNFSVLAIGLFLLLRKPASQALSTRIKEISDNLEELEALKKEAEERLAKCNEKLYALEQEAEKIVSEYARQGNEAKEKILKEAEAAAEKLQAQARKNIDHEFEKAKFKLEAEVFEKAIAKAEELIKSKITVEDQNQLVDEYLDKVVQQ